MNILVTTSSFGERNNRPIKMLKKAKKLKAIYNKTKKEYSKKELINLLNKYKPTGIIAGTERYDSEILNCCKNLKIISRVGIGLDSINLTECKKRNIIVKNTPDAPTNAVAEMVIGQMINLSRRIQESDLNIRKGEWKRYIGKEIKDSVVGIIGCGRIGSSVFTKIYNFNPKKILVNDIVLKKTQSLRGTSFASKEEILKKSDIITLNIPLDSKTKDYISKKELSKVKKNLILINFARGGIINESELYIWLKKNPEARAALDTFKEEPYKGKLTKLPNCYLTPHLGSCSERSRLDMEVGAVKNLLNELKK